MPGNSAGIVNSISSQRSTYYNTVYIEECFNAGNLGNIETTGYATGIIHSVTGTDNSSYIRYCYNTGNIIAKSGECSGIAGNNSCILQYCYNVGKIENNSAEAVGIVNNAKNDIRYCYNLGNIIGGSAGGIVRRFRRECCRINRGNNKN